MSERRPRLLDPHFVSKLTRLDLTARLVVEGFLTGLHRSPYHGFSVEFAEHRQYMPGDPLRHLDWKVLAKSDRKYIKQYEEETNLRAMLLVDTSASMGYGSHGVTKLDYARQLAAALAYLMLRQNDAVGMFAFATGRGGADPSALDPGSRAPAPVPPRAAHAGRGDRFRVVAPLAGRADESPGARGPDLGPPRRSGADRPGDPPFQAQEARGPRVPRAATRRRWRSISSVRRSTWTSRRGSASPTRPQELRPDYRARVNAWRDQLRQFCVEKRADYVPLTTDQPFDRALLEYLSKRSRLL